MEGWVDLGSLIAARPGIEPTTVWSQIRRPSHYATNQQQQQRQRNRKMYVVCRADCNQQHVRWCRYYRTTVASSVASAVQRVLRTPPSFYRLIAGLLFFPPLTKWIYFAPCLEGQFPQIVTKLVQNWVRNQVRLLLILELCHTLFGDVRSLSVYRSTPPSRPNKAGLDVCLFVYIRPQKVSPIWMCR